MLPVGRRFGARRRQGGRAHRVDRHVSHRPGARTAPGATSARQGSVAANTAQGRDNRVDERVDVPPRGRHPRSSRRCIRRRSCRSRCACCSCVARQFGVIADEPLWRAARRRRHRLVRVAGRAKAVPAPHDGAARGRDRVDRARHLHDRMGRAARGRLRVQRRRSPRRRRVARRASGDDLQRPRHRGSASSRSRSAS